MVPQMIKAKIYSETFEDFRNILKGLQIVVDTDHSNLKQLSSFIK